MNVNIILKAILSVVYFVGGVAIGKDAINEYKNQKKDTVTVTVKKGD